MQRRTRQIESGGGYLSKRLTSAAFNPAGLTTFQAARRVVVVTWRVAEERGWKQ